MSSEIVVCSFYTADDYYRGWAEKLRQNLEDLGVDYELLEIEMKEGENWADICRKKVPFIASVCEKYPNKKIFWTDVDCSILSFPDFLRNFSADIVGFQRGFGSPLNIGYGQRARFWEPTFWGINTTPQARKMIRDAAALEAVATIAATDDYFMEEAWRANCENLTFQILPSNTITNKGTRNEFSKELFYTFGSSGSVAEFKGQVVQHKRKKGKMGLRKGLLVTAKRIEKTLPNSVAGRLRLIADTSGITGMLTNNRKKDAAAKERYAQLKKIVKAGQAGDRATLEATEKALRGNVITTSAEEANITAAKSFLDYSDRGSDKKLSLAWWVRPFPGNFGDWLSPLIFAKHTDRNIVFQSTTTPALSPHIISLGSIGRFIKPNSIVVGTGISSEDITLASKADYVSVRGPLTAAVLKKSGGPSVESFGDPGIIISRIVPVERKTTNGRIAFVRHFTHKNVPMKLRDNMDELDVLVGDPAGITDLLVKLNQYDSVVTSAMHIYITCQSYGIPCALVTFEGFEHKVHGTGMKYRDYSLGAGLAEVNPVAIGHDLKKIDLDNIITDYKVSEAKMNEVEAAVLEGIHRYENR
jgi:hypothetical protein